MSELKVNLKGGATTNDVVAATPHFLTLLRVIPTLCTEWSKTQDELIDTYGTIWYFEPRMDGLYAINTEA